ncbi:TRAP transporter substrate-binding protein [Algihabitans albus]|uniref:TRAP transporter substrate-binding protein n=1 Tax=Algihabitans albus TaxID=2164067 RepID=UPI000E5C6DBC|nr:TRAP transporter substrate-binding protein DctP [Algihabitans albus]
MKFMAKTALSALAVTTVAVMPQADAQELKIRFPVEYNADISPGLANQEFIELVEARSNGEIEVEFYPSGSLYKGLDILQAVMRGDAEMATLVSVYWSAVSPQISVFELPFTFPTHEAFYRAADDEAFMSSVFSEIEEKGALVIGSLVYDYLPVGNTERALKMPEDFAGLKLRALGRTNARTLELLGAEPVPINVTEVSAALERGVIDGLNTPADAFISYGWDDVVAYVTDSPHYFAFYPWAVNKAWWEGLSEAHQTILSEAIEEVTRNHRERARTEAALAFEKIAASGIEVHRLTDEQRSAWIEVTKVQWDEAEERFGSELLDKLRSFQQAP